MLVLLERTNRLAHILPQLARDGEQAAADAAPPCRRRAVQDHVCDLGRTHARGLPKAASTRPTAPRTARKLARAARPPNCPAPGPAAGAHRLGLKSRPSPVKAKPKAKKGAKPAPKAKKPPTKSSVAAKPKEEHVARRAMPPPTPAARTHAAQQARQPKHDGPKIVSVGPGGFLRQGPGDQHAPSPPPAPRRLVPAKTSRNITATPRTLDLHTTLHPGRLK